MEDMLQQGPWEHLDALKTISLQDASFILEHMAKLHAHFWNKTPILKQILKPSRSCSPPMYVTSAWAKFKHNFGKKKEFEQVVKLGNLFFHNYYAFMQYLDAKEPATLLHNDWRLDHMAIRRYEKQLVLTNWMFITQGPAVMDVVMFLGNTMPAQEISSMQPILLRNYHQALIRNLPKDTQYSFEQFSKDFSLCCVLMLNTCLGLVRTRSVREKQLAAFGLDRLIHLIKYNNTLELFEEWQGK
jgi:hypothetical protein